MFSKAGNRLYREWVSQGKKDRVTAFMALALILLIGVPATAPAVDYQVQGGAEANAQAEQEAVDLHGEQGAQANQEAQELMDIELPEDEMFFFDPESIPDSVPLPRTTWVFQVPIDVTDLPAEVERIGVYCQVFSTSVDPIGQASASSCGEGKKRVDVVNGAVSETVTIGIEGDWARRMYRTYAAPWLGDKWECKMYLIGPDHRWKIPSTDVVHPAWRQADPDEQFRWHAGPHPLPAEARVADPDGS